MQLSFEPEFLSICQEIVEEGWTDDEWRERESSDWFQTPSFCGGYDADEAAFCFSYYDPAGNEWLFQVTLSEVRMVSAGGRPVVELRRAG